MQTHLVILETSQNSGSATESDLNVRVYQSNYESNAIDFDHSRYHELRSKAIKHAITLQ